MVIQRKSGFTLVELLVTIAIVGILMTIAIPAIQAVRESANRVACANNIRQIALAANNYQSSHGQYPSGIHSSASSTRRNSTWLATLLPFVEQDNLYNESQDWFQAGVSAYFHTVAHQPVPTYECPSDPRSGRSHFSHGFHVALTSYMGVCGTDYQSMDGIFYSDSLVRPSEITDGLSNTLMIGERPASSDEWFGWWYAGFGQAGSGSPDMLLGVRERNDGASNTEGCPLGLYGFKPGDINDQCSTFHYWSLHGGGAQFAFADGSVKMISYEIGDVFVALGTRAGGEVVSNEY